MHMDGVRAAHRRPRPSPPRVLRLVLGLALIAASLTVAAVAHVPTASAAGVCTGWTSSIVPPQTIRVLRTSGPAMGTVQTVDFHQYVETVIAAEWSPGPADAVDVGAVAVKQYAWYWTMVWRGHRAADGTCYDVIDTTQDQIYRPEHYSPIPALNEAVDETWTISLHRSGRLFDTGYRTGASVACGADVDGTILYQVSLYRCAKAGETFDQLIHQYLDPVTILRPGAGDSTGDGLGDISVVTSGGDTTTVRLYGSGKVTTPPTAVTTALGAPVALPITPAQTIFRSLADVTGDHLDDLLILQRLSDQHFQIWVAPSVGDGFGTPTLWWDSALSSIPFLSGGLVRFVTGDFNGDGQPDAALLVASQPQALPPTPTPTPNATPTPTPTAIPTVVIGGTPVTAMPTPTPTAHPTPTATPARTATPTLPGGGGTSGGAGPWATLWLLPGNGTTLGPATAIWSGPLSLDGTTVFAGDVDGDGRADLIVQEDLGKQPGGGTGVGYVVVPTGAAFGSAPVPWLTIPGLAATQARTVATDVDGDGKMDLVVDRMLGASGTEMDGLISTGSAFTDKVLWKNATSFRWSASRIAAADVDGDGRGDIVVLYNGGNAGTRLYRFLSTGSALKSAGATTDPTLTWSGAAPY